jgi:hypothetical protein
MTPFLKAIREAIHDLVYAVAFGVFFFIGYFTIFAAYSASLHFGILLSTTAFSISCILVFSVLRLVPSDLERKERESATMEFLFSSVLFCATILLGAAGAYTVSLKWYNLVGLAVFSGIGAWSLNLLQYFRRSRAQFEIQAKKTRDPELFARKLELEHSEKRDIIRWTVWAILVFVTTGVASFLFGQASRDASSSVSDSMILNTSVIAIWAVIGLWFGVITPVFLHMGHIRELMGRLSFEQKRKMN